MGKTNRLMYFLKRGEADPRITPTLVSFYLALFCSWEESGCQVAFRTSRKNIMILARIHSTATYHKCVREMTEFGFIHYEPGYDRFKGSEFKLLFD